MREYELRERIHRAMDTQLPGVREDPYLARRILAEARGGKKVKRKISVGMALCLALLVISVTALAVTLWNGHRVELFENVALGDLLSEQWQQYDVCHRVSGGYLAGGFELGDDYIAPMGEEDKILYLNEHFTLVWTLGGEELAGCLFDRAEEAGGCFYFGMERQREDWAAAIMKVSREGEILWTWEGEGEFKAKDFLATREGAVYCAGRNGDAAVLLKIGQDGRSEWERNLGEYGAAALNAIAKWGDGLLGAGQCGEGVVLLRMDEQGAVRSRAVYDVDEPIDAVRLRELADGRLALVLSLRAGEPGEKATGETKYMIVSEGIFE